MKLRLGVVAMVAVLVAGCTSKGDDGEPNPPAPTGSPKVTLQDFLQRVQANPVAVRATQQLPVQNGLSPVALKVQTVQHAYFASLGIQGLEAWPLVEVHASVGQVFIKACEAESDRPGIGYCPAHKKLLLIESGKESTYDYLRKTEGEFVAQSGHAFPFAMVYSYLVISGINSQIEGGVAGDPVDPKRFWRTTFCIAGLVLRGLYTEFSIEDTIGVYDFLKPEHASEAYESLLDGQKDGRLAAFNEGFTNSRLADCLAPPGAAA